LNDWFINGAAAEYCVAKSAEIAKKPTSIDHLHAASVPISGLTAWQGLFDRGKLQPGQKVLIHGGAGGVGSFAIQLAAWKGAFVITTVSEADISFVRALGAREVIDYRKVRFEELVTDADLVLDLVGGDTLRASFRAVKPAGRVITIAASSESETDPKFKEAFFIVAADANQLMEITKLIDTGVLRTVVREVLPIDAAAQAYSPTKTKGRGKTVLQVVDSVEK
jgi:NADPH:quinone reductase-like Zn-dependent oxidoreductase